MELEFLIEQKLLALLRLKGLGFSLYIKKNKINLDKATQLVIIKKNS